MRSAIRRDLFSVSLDYKRAADELRHIEYNIGNEFDGKKVLSFLRSQAGLSARLINSLKRIENGITLNGVHIRTIDIVHTGDILAVNIPDDENTAEPIYYPLEIIYVDCDNIIINKPAGLAMHQTHNHQGDTLANAVSSYFQSKGKCVTFRAVGRLDKGTSGLVLCALNRLAASKLSGNLKKTYYALVSGEYNGSGTIDKPIYRPDPMKTLRAVGETGDRAVTHWEAVMTDGKISFLKINLETGRTHQIRVHFASEGTPLCGDDMYGSIDKRITRPALHCGNMSFKHPVTDEFMSFFAPLPDDIASLLPDKNFTNFLNDKLIINRSLVITQQ